MEHNLRRLRDLKNFEVASDDPDVRGWDVKTREGRAIGEVDELIVDPDARKVRYLEVELNRDAVGSGEQRHVSIPIESAEIDRRDRAVLVSGYARDARGSSPGADYGTAAKHREPSRPDERRLDATGTRDITDERVMPDSRPAEGLRTKPVRDAGDVILGKRVDTEHVSQPVTVTRERVRVDRRPVGGDVRSGEVRMEDGQIRIPIVEEELIVEKRAVVKEELIVSKEVVQEEQRIEEDLRKERYDVRNDDRSNADRTTSRTKR